MLKNHTKVIDIETEAEWRVDRRTRGEDTLNDSPFGKPTPTWVLIMSNSKGERRFVSEKRVWEFFRLPEAPK